VQITGVDSPQILDQAFEAAHKFHPLSRQEVASVLDRTRSAAQNGQFELYKTTGHFDGTAHKPEMLG